MFWSGIWRDIRHVSRGLRKGPAFVAVVVLTLGLGIGANTAIFSLMDQVLLRTLPVRDPGTLVQLDGPGAFMGRTFNDQTFSYPMYRDFRDGQEVFSGVLARFPTAMTVVWRNESSRVNGELVSGNYFDVLGIGPALGRVLTQKDDETPGAHPVVVLSHGYWTRRFGNDPSILGGTLVVNGHPLTIVGVSARGFSGIQSDQAADLMVPVMMKAQMSSTWNDLDNRRSRWLTVIARLKPGVSREEAETRMNVLYSQINRQELADIPGASGRFQERFLAKKLHLLPGARGVSDLRDDVSTPLIVLMCMVGLVLLIACANVANLLLARTTSRSRELAVRLALGAGTGRIVRQQLVESLLLALAGAVLGVIIASWTGALLLSVLPGETGSSTLSADPDMRMVLFALGLSVVTALVFGIGPALAATRAAVVTALKDEAGSVAGGGRQARVRRGLVIAQVALSMLLLAGAGLFARTLFNLRTVDPGFDVEHMLTFSVDPSLNGYSQERIHALATRMHEELAAIPGVLRVSAAESSVLSGDAWSSTIRVDGYQPKEGENMNPLFNGVGPAFFETMGMTLLDGREFDERDTREAPRVAVINAAMARYFFGDGPAIGRRFGIAGGSPTDIEIVGVVADTRSLSLRDEPQRSVYLPYRQSTDLTALTFYVRTTAGMPPPSAAVQAAVKRVDGSLPIYGTKLMTAQVSESLFVDRMVATLSVAFGGLATLLAAIGLYGVMSFAVARRTREIGIRMALGAERARVLWLVLREAAVLTSIGIALGIAGAVYLSRQIESQLFGLSPLDPPTLAGSLVLLSAVALLAGYVPARRASGIDPLIALRAE